MDKFKIDFIAGSLIGLLVLVLGYIIQKYLTKKMKPLTVRKQILIVFIGIIIPSAVGILLALAYHFR